MNPERDKMLGISIIVPLLNEVAAVQELLAHLSELSEHFHKLNDASALEIILVDGGSNDGSFQAISRVSKESGFTLIQSEPGRSIQMNAGAAIASQATLLFLHADTRLPPNFATEIQRAELWGRFDVRFDVESLAMNTIAKFMNARSRLTGVATGDQALFINADIFSSIGGFPAIQLMEDVAISKTLRQLHTPYCSRAKVTTSARRWQQNGVINTVLKMWFYRLAFFLGVSPDYLARGYYGAR